MQLSMKQCKRRVQCINGLWAGVAANTSSESCRLIEEAGWVPLLHVVFHCAPCYSFLHVRHATRWVLQRLGHMPNPTIALLESYLFQTKTQKHLRSAHSLPAMRCGMIKLNEIIFHAHSCIMYVVPHAARWLVIDPRMHVQGLLYLL